VNSERKHNQAYESKHDEKWNKFFMELVEYKENNGDCNCPIKKNGTLGRWIARQRTFFRSNILKTDHHEKLVGIGFAFEDARFATDNKKWNRFFTELVEYKQKNGHCNILTTNGSLGNWITRQRTLNRSKELKADRYEKLVGIGLTFEDVRFATDNKKWNRLFTELVEYKQKNGHCNVPTTNGSFGNWVSNQRAFFRSKKLKEDRYEKLVGIGFLFTDNEKWNRLFMELVEYKQKNGHCNFPTRNGSFGKWISTQRTLFRSKKLNADRYEKLVGIGFIFEDVIFAMDYEKWNKFFMELVEYKQQNGHCDFPTTNGSFGKWISTQRTLFRSKKLKEDRYEKLVGIGFAFEDVIFAMDNEKWNRLFMELVEYKQKNGHCDFPTTNGSFGNWVSTQRALFRSKKLKEDRYEKLVGIGFA